MDYEAMGLRIKKARIRREITQKEAAKQVGISSAFFGLIERGKRKASLETIVAISNVFNVSLDELLADSLSLWKNAKEADYSVLIPEQKKMLSDAIKILYENFPE
jgi:transcriptional regulator with XRE-family HTH domain